MVVSLGNEPPPDGVRREGAISFRRQALGLPMGELHRLRWVARVLAGALLVACESAPTLPASANSGSGRAASAGNNTTSASEPIDPIPLEIDVDVTVAALGEALFFSPIMSADGRVACSGCHALDHGLADRSPVSDVSVRPVTSTNSTGLFNVRYYYKINWIGTFESLDAHLDALIGMPKIMGSNWGEITQRLSADSSWISRFRAVFPDGVTAASVRTAMLEYERSLVTPNAPFDRWLRGDAGALSPESRHGYELFKDYGCIGCHQGMAVGANMLERFGVMSNHVFGPSQDGGAELEVDLGRYNLTHREADRYVFRVPSLRNVALTAPYFHRGWVATLEDAVRTMADVQLGRDLSEPDIRAIVAFLGSLTGEYRGQRL
jgi:cytochrome c peroxidase